MVAILMSTILQGPHGQYCGTTRAIIFNNAKGMVCKILPIIFVLMDSDLHLYWAALLVAAQYKMGDVIRVP